MSAPDHERVAELFARARRLPAAEREAFLAQACGADAASRAEVESLLRHDDSDLLERAERAVAAEARELGARAAPDSPEGPDLPDSIGGYRILRLIGAGGMGAVYEAEQSRPQRRVALKVIRPGLATPALLRRFEHEAEVLGWLDHPGIARIFEAGMSEGPGGPRPYFAMELVRGEPIHHHARARSLSVRARLELIARVAEAVHHAHQKGVIHRDLKPANVLVDASGQPKVLDFGVARVTDADLKTTTLLTRAGELVGTLPYMSPEQVAGDPSELDARADVYALGVIAYELLSGQLPHDLSALPLPEAARRITQEEPTTLSALDRRFRGDVEVIVGKALAAEKERRYGSAEELAQDIRRHLADEPIHARPPSGAYQLAKFARRNRALVGGLALSFVALLAGTVVSTAQYLDARAGRAAEKAQRELAEDNAEAADRVSEFLVDLFQLPDTSVDWGDSITARELLDRGARDISTGLLDQPRVRARLMRTMGRVYGNLGLQGDARPLLEQALALDREAGDGEQIAAGLFRLGTLEDQAGEYERAEELLREARAALTDAGLDGGQAFADVLGSLAAAQTHRGDYEAAEASARLSLERNAALHGEDSLETTFPLATLAVIHEQRDEWEQALSTAQRVLKVRKRVLSDEHPDLIAALALVGRIQFEQGDTAAALASAREVYEVETRRLPEDHPRRVNAMHALAVALQANGELREAEELLRAVCERTGELYGDRNPRYADSLQALGSLQHELSEYSEAEASLRQALAIREETLGPEHLDVASTLNTLGMTLTLGQRRPGDAIPLLERALDIAQDQLGGPERATVASILGNLVTAEGYAGHYDRARDTLLELLDLYRELRGPVHPDVARTLHNLTMVVYSLGDEAAALEYAYQCREVQEALLPELHPDRAFNCDAIGRILFDQKRYDEAEAEFRHGLEIREASLPASHVSTGESLAMVAMCLVQRGAYAEAEPLLLRALEICRATYGPTNDQVRYALARVQNLYRAWGQPEEADRYLELYEAAGGRPGSGAGGGGAAAPGQATSGEGRTGSKSADPPAGSEGADSREAGPEGAGSGR